MPIISIINNKGGVAKTTTTFMLGAYLADQGKRVLLIDFDAQMNLTDKVGALKKDKVPYNIVDLLNGKPNPEFFTNEDGTLFTCMGTEDIDVYFNFSNKDVKEYNDKKNSLKRYEDIFKKNFDYVLIDCQPRILNEALLTSNEVALLASDYVIVPASPDKDSIAGFQKVISTIKRIQPDNPKLKLLGLVFTLIGNRNEIVYNQYKQFMKSNIGDLFFTSDIRRNTDMQQALNLNTTIFNYNSKSISAQDYTAFAEEVVERINKFEKR